MKLKLKAVGIALAIVATGACFASAPSAAVADSFPCYALAKTVGGAAPETLANDPKAPPDWVMRELNVNVDTTNGCETNYAGTGPWMPPGFSTPGPGVLIAYSPQQGLAQNFSIDQSLTTCTSQFVNIMGWIPASAYSDAVGIYLEGVQAGGCNIVVTNAPGGAVIATLFKSSSG